MFTQRITAAYNIACLCKLNCTEQLSVSYKKSRWGFPVGKRHLILRHCRKQRIKLQKNCWIPNFLVCQHPYNDNNSGYLDESFNTRNTTTERRLFAHRQLDVVRKHDRQNAPEYDRSLRWCQTSMKSLHPLMWQYFVPDEVLVKS